MQKAIVFGGSGFVGRHVVRNLCRAGYRILVACRDPERALRTKTAGMVGQIVPVKVNICDPKTLGTVMAGCDVVINCCGILSPMGQSFQDVHTVAPENIAIAAKENGVRNLIHISAIGADSNHKSKYARSKAGGEAAILEHFPDATILRPSVIFGPGDGLFERFARMAQFSPVLPVIGGGTTRFQPVYVGDVADAVINAIENTQAKGKTYELAGPEIYSFRQILEIVLTCTKKKRAIVSLPFALAYLIAIPGSIAARLFGLNLLTLDQLRLLKCDNIANTNALGLADLGITPVNVKAALPQYVSSLARVAFV